MKVEIRTISSKFLVGMYKEMSPADNTTPELWQKFMPRRAEIQYLIPHLYYAVQEYAELLNFKDFNSNSNFKMWAAIEVDKLSILPADMASLTLPTGKYAVFIHKGKVDTFYQTSKYIFEHWLPTSGYELDLRPHFQVMDKNYRPDDPTSQEEVWIPLKS